jgi:D-sedoheptulose 7-phosphate isomerase
MHHKIEIAVLDHIELAKNINKQYVEIIVDIASMLIKCVKNDGALLWCGNGGSAADSQHLAAELLGRFKRNRRAIRSMALTTDTSVLTAIGNDFGYKYVFSRQVEGVARKGDVLIAISTSGNSENVLQAIKQAKISGVNTVALLGSDGGKIKSEVDIALIVPSSDTARIQEMHGMIGHILCDMVERTVAEENA